MIPNLYYTPFTLNTLLERIFFDFMQCQYLSMTKARLVDSLGIRYFNSKLEYLDPHHRKYQKKRIQDNINHLKSFKSQIFNKLEEDKSHRTFQNWITYSTCDWLLTNCLFGYKHMIYMFPVFLNTPLIYPSNPWRGCIKALFIVLKTVQRLDSVSDFKIYTTRINNVPKYIDGLIEDLQKRKEKGIIMDVESLKYTNNNSLKFYIGNGEVTNHILYKRCERKLDSLDSICAEKKKSILIDVGVAIKHSLVPSIQKLIDYHASLIPDAPKEIGVWRIPKGDEIYRFHIYYYTSTTMHPMDIHEYGMKEIESISKKIIELVKPQFIFDQKKETFGQFLKRILSDPKFNYPNTESGKKDSLENIKKIFEESREKSKDLFEYVPSSNVQLIEENCFKDTTFYYRQAPYDHSEDPKIFINFDHKNTLSKILQKACAYKEGFPGHHLQTEVARSRQDIDIFRKNFISSSYFNGWGFYSETLTIDYGWVTDKWEILGHYILDLRITSSMVLDCSIHYQGLRWDTKKSLSFLVDKIGCDKEVALREIRMTTNMPGIGLSQKIGQMKFLDLREHAKNQLGNKFDIKQFHSVILNNGSLPLDILAQVVEYWIVEKNNQDPTGAGRN
eukprot:gene3834-4777_t